jgi:hypothetical protein
MSLFPAYGPPISSVVTETQSDDLFEMDVASLSWTADAGTLTAATGHAGTWSRGTTLASVSDALGSTYTALDAAPAYEQRDWDGDGVRESFGLRMDTSDRLAWPTSLRPMAHAGLLEIIETGARTTSGATLFALRNDGATGAGLWLDTSGTYYRMNYSDGSTTRTATLASGQPASGDRVQFLWELTAEGVLTFSQSINGGTATIATAAALALPAAWASSASFRWNSQGTSANPAQGWYRRGRIVAGALDPLAIVARR